MQASRETQGRMLCFFDLINSWLPFPPKKTIAACGNATFVTPTKCLPFLHAKSLYLKARLASPSLRLGVFVATVLRVLFAIRRTGKHGSFRLAENANGIAFID